MTTTFDIATSGSVSDTASADGRLIAGRFRLLEPLGRGGMGRVFRARDELLGRLVAVKLIYGDAIADSDVRHACALEARAAARLNHPGIVRILDSGFDDGHLYVVMRLANGRTLSEIIRSEGPLPVARALEIAAQVADALAAAHQEGIIHCDVKPGNLIVREDGTVQLVDFGIARIAASTTSLDSSTFQGSAEYVAPEQVEGAAVDGRTDLYALGVVLYETLVGRTPFGGGTVASVLARRLANSPPSIRDARPDVLPAVGKIVTRMLARAPDERFQTASQLRDALQAARVATLAETLPPPPLRQLTATMPFPGVRAAARGRAARARAFAQRQQSRYQELGKQAGVAAAAGLLTLIRQARQLGVWTRKSFATRLAQLSEIGARISTRRPSLVTGFGIAVAVGLLIGTLAARCNVVGAADTAALTPDTASAATVAPAPPQAPPTPTVVVAQPASTEPSATATAAPTSTPRPPPPTVVQAVEPEPPAQPPAPLMTGAPATKPEAKQPAARKPEGSKPSNRDDDDRDDWSEKRGAGAKKKR